MNSLKSKQIIAFLTLISFFLGGCNGKLPGGDARKFPADPKKRVEQNLKEGRGFRLNDMVKQRGGTFDFASSNELWRASLDVIDFMPLSSVNYSGGIIITDWYSETNTNDSVKITVRFLANEIRSDSLKIIIHKKTCTTNSNCNVSLLKNSNIGNELLSSILREAAAYEKQVKTKKK